MILASIHGRIVPNMCRCINIGDSITRTIIHKSQGKTNYATPLVRVNKISLFSSTNCSYKNTPATTVTFTFNNNDTYTAVIKPQSDDDQIEIKHDIHFDAVPTPIIVKDICLMCKLYDLMHKNGVYER